MPYTNIPRRSFLKGLAATGAATLLSPHARAAAQTAQRPNVVFFMVDDMGWMDSTVYGSRYYETPNMERLARRSVRFTNAYSASPLCTPTRASVMTGKYPGRLHITGASGHVPPPTGPLLPESGLPSHKILSPRCQGYLPLEEYTIGEALKDAGYRTAFIGKWHLGHDEKYWPEHQGFDINIGGGRWPGPPSYFSPYRISNLPNGPQGEYIADRLTEESVTFIEENHDGPFFLNLWHYSIHAPYQCKEEYREYFANKKDPRGAQDNAVMAGMIKSMDDSLGRVLDTLEDLELTDNTIIVFTSDNGGNMYDRVGPDGTNYGAWAPQGRTPTNNAPLRSGKGSVYEGGVRVPTMFYWPGNARGGTVSDQPMSSIDFYPTLLDMLDIAPKEGKVFDGISVVPALMGKKLKRDALYCHFPHAPAAVPVRQSSWVREGDWKLIRFYELDEYFPNRIELYNLKDDIGELHNVADRHPRKVKRLEAMLDEHLESSGALVPKENPAFDPRTLKTVAGWASGGWCWLEPGAGVLHVHCTGDDPLIIQDDVPPATGKLSLQLRMKSNSGGVGHFFWAFQPAPHFARHWRVEWSPQHDNQWHEYTIPFETVGELARIRIDPASAEGEIDIDWIALVDADEEVLKRWDF